MNTQHQPTGLSFLVDHAHKAAREMELLRSESEDEQNQACARLFAAKMLRHVTDLYLFYRSGCKRYAVEGRDAYEWIFDSENKDEVASFEWICEILRLNPRAVRDKIWSTCEHYRQMEPKTSSVGVISDVLAHAKAVA